MKTLAIVALGLCMAAYFADPQARTKTPEELRADSTAAATKAPPADTTGFVGAWHIQLTH